jgi:hypothetical protein
MLKVIRKYRAWATGTSQSLLGGDPGKVTVARLGKDRLTRAEALRYEQEFDALEQYVPELVQGVLRIENGVHWMLLVREAERAGLIGSAGDGEAWIDELAEDRLLLVAQQQVLMEMPQLADMLRANPRFLRSLAMRKLAEPAFREAATSAVQAELIQHRQILADRSHLTLDEFNMALARLRGVERLVTHFTQANARLSDAGFVAGARRYYEPAVADGVVIRSSLVVSEVSEPTDEQVRAHYEQFRAVEPGTPPNGFGYVQPRRVKLEWMHVSRDAISKAVVVDPVTVQKRYQLDRAKYPGEFAAERPRIEAEVRAERTDELLALLDGAYKSLVKSALRRVEVEAGVRRLPGDWETARPPMERLAREAVAAVKERAGVDLPMPSVTVSGQSWTRLDRAENLPGIGGSMYASGTRRESFSGLLSTLVEFGGPVNLGLQSRVPFDTALVDAKGDRFYVTVLDWRERSSPDGLEDVRSDVVQDLKLLAAFERLRAESPKFAALAVSDGLTAVGKLFEKPEPNRVEAIPVTNGIRVTRLNTSPAMPELQDQAFRDRVLAAFEALGRTTPPTPENVAARTLVIELPATLSVAVVQLTYPEPITEEQLRTVRPEQIREITSMEWQPLFDADFKAPFSMDALKNRAGYEELIDRPAPAEVEKSAT